MKPISVHMGILIVLCTVVQARASSIYDAVADFSTSQNTDTSAWSYRYQTGLDRDGLYPLLPAFTSLNVFTPLTPAAWVFNVGGPLGYEVPLVGVNQTGSDLTYIDGDPNFPYPFVWPSGTMLIHPGPFDPGLVVVSWLSPVDALVNINFGFSDMDNSLGNGVDWFVERNNSAGTLSAGGFTEGGSSGLQSLNHVAVGAGDRINFIVDPAGDYNFDSTSLTATISLVPEPYTAALFGLGLLGCLWIWRRRENVA